VAAVKKAQYVIKDTIWRKIRAQVSALGRTHVRIGVLGSKGGNASHDGITMVELAAIHEFGSPAAHIPERSFIRRTFDVERVAVSAMSAKLAKAVVARRMDHTRALGLLGAWGASAVKNIISKGQHIPPPLKPATVARKGSDRPLVDTGRLVGAIQFEVIGAGAGPAPLPPPIGGK
jgi:hypothetical protein